MRPSGRTLNGLRDINIQRHYTKHAEGSVLISCGDTQVLCTASVEERVPAFLKGKKQGWVTAEYSMLPRSTHTRNQREARQNKPNGRSQEIQRLIARSMRAVVDLKALGERTITLDCDVIQADGGTRTASITGAYVALHDACAFLLNQQILKTSPLQSAVVAVSVGIYQGTVVLDLDYAEDRQAETDMNVVMNDKGEFIEIQGTAEGHTFQRTELNHMLDFAAEGIEQLFILQQQALSEV